MLGSLRRYSSKLETVSWRQFRSEIAADRVVPSNNRLALQEMINEARTVSAQKRWTDSWKGLTPTNGGEPAVYLFAYFPTCSGRTLVK
jgi:hypothetical protein